MVQYECRVIFSNDILLLNLEWFDKHVSFRQKRYFIRLNWKKRKIKFHIPQNFSGNSNLDDIISY